MIKIKKIDAQHKADINIPNEPFELSGKIIPSYNNGIWTYNYIEYTSQNITKICFPDENYDYDTMSDSVFLGAYDGENCVGLAILQPGFFKYMYLYDLKVNKKYRRQHIGKQLIQHAKETAIQNGYRGLYTQSSLILP